MIDSTMLMRLLLDADDGKKAAALRVLSGEPETRRRTGTIKQAAAILSCCPRTVARYVERGMITPVRLSQRKIRYDLNQVERLADGSL